MVTWILDQEVAGSRPICILCFFIYRFTSAGEEVGGTESGVAGGGLGTTKVHFICGVLSNVEIHSQRLLLKFWSYTLHKNSKILVSVLF